MKDAARARCPLSSSLLAPLQNTVKKDLLRDDTHYLELLAVDARLRVHGLAVRVALHV